jgi:hypothetical protein
MSGADSNRELDDLADALWAERHVVEYLLFKLVTAKLVLAADERRFVGLALDEVERVVRALRDAELRRASALATLAVGWGMPVAELSLAELAARAPRSWRSVFRDHQEGFRKLAEEIEETSAANRRLASAGLAHVRATLGALTGPEVPQTYTATGRPDTSPTVPLRLDRVL